jgi:hypothetical protein
MPCCSLFAFVLAIGYSSVQPIEGITFANKPGAIYVPIREAAKSLGWAMEYDKDVELVRLKGTTLDPKRPQLSDGTWLISLAELAKLDATVNSRHAESGGKAFDVKVGPKRVLIDLRAQILRAWQGERLIYLWKTSSGREGKETPNGSYKAGTKEPMHISTIYGSQMPFSVHLSGNMYVHGSPIFSSSPGSHGCIRLPMMTTRNVAEEFYNWIETGVPIQVQGAYKFQKRKK